MNMEENREMNMEIIEEEAISKNIASLIKGIFKNAGETVIRISNIFPQNFWVLIEGGNKTLFRVTWAPKFVAIYLSEEKPILVEAFTQAIGFRPFCRYVKNELLVFEWNWMNANERFAELRNKVKEKRIYKLVKLEL
ncbi:MAG: hypothetical protein U9Q72_00485 [Patescibacteria group bacterium]|nr:hypothetical protein [Patescibacteria group bacterium]